MKMNKEYDNEMSGVAFTNDYKKTDKQPTYRGTLTINGVEYKQAVWEKVAKSGKKYLSFQYELPTDEPRRAIISEPSAASEELDENIPF